MHIKSDDKLIVLLLCSSKNIYFVTFPHHLQFDDGNETTERGVAQLSTSYR